MGNIMWLCKLRARGPLPGFMESHVLTCASEIVSDQIDALYVGFRPAGVFDINTGKPAGGLVRMDIKYHCRNGPLGGHWGQYIYCQWLLIDNIFIVKNATKDNLNF